jgi:hypothetical protein
MKNQINMLLGALLMLLGCEPNFRNSTFPCNECVAVKMVSKKTGKTVYFDKDTITLTAPMYQGHDSLIIKRNGVVVVALPNFKHVYEMDDKKRRNMYYKSVSDQGIKTMRFHYPRKGEFPLITSQLIDGVYRDSADTVDVYYLHTRW